MVLHAVIPVKNLRVASWTKSYWKCTESKRRNM